MLLVTLLVAVIFTVEKCSETLCKFRRCLFLLVVNAGGREWLFNSAKEFLYHPFILSKSIICRFYNSKRGLWGRSSWKWLFSLSKTHSGRMFFISFREIRFYLHKEISFREIRFYLHKEISFREIRFYLQKEKLKIFHAARANLLRVWWYI